jgi:hypothetical protein
MTGHRGGWPALDAPGRYKAECSCSLEKTGTPVELAHFRRLHRDPGGNHVVSIADDGRRADLSPEGEPL